VNPPAANAAMGKPIFKASDGGQIDMLGEREDVTKSELLQGPGRGVLLSIKVRPESFPTGSPMPAWLGFLQYLGEISHIVAGAGREARFTVP
jgi:hypothetical protein